MAIIFDVYSIPTLKWLDIISITGSTSPQVDAWFLKEYGATVIQGTWDQWQYMFPDREKYVEFCLKWL